VVVSRNDFLNVLVLLLARGFSMFDYEEEEEDEDESAGLRVVFRSGFLPNHQPARVPCLT